MSEDAKKQYFEQSASDTRAREFAHSSEWTIFVIKCDRVSKNRHFLVRRRFKESELVSAYTQNNATFRVEVGRNRFKTERLARSIDLGVIRMR